MTRDKGEALEREALRLMIELSNNSKLTNEVHYKIWRDIFPENESILIEWLRHAKRCKENNSANRGF
jgi:hypothetical protein